MSDDAETYAERIRQRAVMMKKDLRRTPVSLSESQRDAFVLTFATHCQAIITHCEKMKMEEKL